MVAQLVAPDFYPQLASEGSGRGVTLLAGLATGLLAGGVLFLLERLLCGKSSTSVIASLALVGMVLGWQLTALAMGLVTVCYLLLQLAAGRRQPLSVLLFTTAVILLLIVRWQWSLDLLSAVFPT